MLSHGSAENEKVMAGQTRVIMLQNEAVVSSVRMLSHGSAENEKVMAGQRRVIMLQNEAVS